MVLDLKNMAVLGLVSRHNRVLAKRFLNLVPGGVLKVILSSRSNSLLQS